MNTIKAFTSHYDGIADLKITKKSLSRKTDILIDVVQALIDRIAEKEGVKLDVMAIPSEEGLKFILCEPSKSVIEPPTNAL